MLHKTGIMQPYFLPYIGYFQLISAVDLFIVYDNIKFTKKGWINRNRLLLNGQDSTFTLPIKNGSDSLDVRDRELATEFNRSRLLNQIKGAYTKAPYFNSTFPLLERIVGNDENNLFRFIENSIREICEHLAIKARIKKSSEFSIDHTLKGQEKVLALCKNAHSDTYINAIGGIDLYSKEAFQSHGVKLKFIRSKPFEYKQFDHAFVPWLSIVDVMMFNSIETIQEALENGYTLE